MILRKQLGVKIKRFSKGGPSVKPGPSTKSPLYGAMMKDVGTPQATPSATPTLDKVGKAVNEGVTRLGRTVLPLNAALYMQDLTGQALKKATGENFLTKHAPTPVTEKDLSPQELAVLTKATQNADKEHRQSPEEVNPNHKYKGFEYRNYPDADNHPEPKDFGTLYHALTHPTARMMTAVGGGSYRKNEKGETEISDKFNFDGDMQQELVDYFTYNPHQQTNPYAQLYKFIGRNGSNKEDEGIPVNINLGKTEAPPKKRKGGVLPRSFRSGGLIDKPDQSAKASSTATPAPSKLDTMSVAEKNRIIGSQQAKAKDMDKASTKANKQAKAVAENVLNGVSYARYIPHPLTQGIGWGAALAASGVDAYDAGKALSEGDTDTAKSEALAAAVNMTPFKNVKGGIAEFSKLAGQGIRASKGVAGRVLLANAGNIGGAVNAGYDLADLHDGVQAFKKEEKPSSLVGPELQQSINDFRKKKEKEAEALTVKKRKGGLLPKKLSKGGSIDKPKAVILGGLSHEEEGDNGKGNAVMDGDVKVAETESEELQLTREHTTHVMGLVALIDEGQDQYEQLGRYMRNVLLKETVDNSGKF
jgi:hypothetical protein